MVIFFLDILYKAPYAAIETRFFSAVIHASQLLETDKTGVKLKGHENRKLERYRVRDGAMAVIGKNANVLGQIIDISRGGLSFRYMDNGIIEVEEDLLTILSTDQQFYLVNIPFQTVSDFALVDIPTFSSIIMRRRCVRFGNLDDEQIRRLDEFIRKYAAGGGIAGSDVSGNAVSM